MAITQHVTIKEVEHIAHTLAKQFLEWGEPIPDFGSRFPSKLESCLLTPFQTFSKRQLYKGLISKSSILFYLMIKNHPFQNGNKRIAMTTLFFFLYKNNKWLRVENQKLYNFAKWVAMSDPQVKDQTVDAIHVFIQTHIVGRN